MKRWQQIVTEHCHTKVINENTIRIDNARYGTEESFNDYITYDEEIMGYIVDVVRQTGKHEIVETEVYKSIYDYLNY